MILFIIQARMSSKRLPGKVLAKIKDQTTILDLILRRLKKLSYFKKIYYSYFKSIYRYSVNRIL